VSALIGWLKNHVGSTNKFKRVKMTQLLIRKPGRPTGSLSEKGKQNQLKRNADSALEMLKSITDDPNAEILVKINAAHVLLEHYRNYPSSQKSSDC
jgi:hypothetical protein